MKRFLFCILLAQLTLPLQAENSPQPKQNRLEALITILQISESQETEFLSVMAAQHEQRKAIREQYSESRKAQRTEMKALHQETLDKLQSVLSLSQVDAFKAVMRQKHRKHNHNNMHPVDAED